MLTIDTSYLPESGYVRLSQILKVFPVSKATWWKGVKEGAYPPSVKLGKRITAWKVEDIRELMDSLSSEPYVKRIK